MSGQLYLSKIKLFALVLDLVLGILQIGLNAHLRPFLSNQIGLELFILLFSSSQCPVGLDLNFVLGVLDLLLSHKILLDSLHINNKGVR